MKKGKAVGPSDVLSEVIQSSHEQCTLAKIVNDMMYVKAMFTS